MSEQSSRRRFIKAAALGTAGAFAAGPALAQDPAPSSAERQAQALAEIVRLRFGQHLNAAQMKSVQQRLARSLATSEQLKRTRLENGDEPAFVFVPGE
jgi:hypothetical protein